MASTSAPVPPQAKSQSLAKPVTLAAVIFLAAAGLSFLFLRNPTPTSVAQPRLKPPAAVVRNDNQSQNDLQRERLLESIGSVSSIYLYQSYLNVGLIADAVKNDTYSKDEAVELLSTIVTLLQTVDAQMQKLESVGLDDEEVAAVKQVRSISSLIKSQTTHLQSHWKTGEKSNLDQFHQTRRQSWTELCSILGLGAQNPAKAE
jgi:hypothetical protein